MSVNGNDKNNKIYFSIEERDYGMEMDWISSHNLSIWRAIKWR